MKTTKRVYDLPTRTFHWLFVGLFVSAFFIAKTMDSDSPTFPYHMLIGITLGATTVLRVIWGFVGSRYARFSSYQLSPGALVNYFKGIMTGKGIRQLGHNPASSWSALIMMALALSLAATGMLMAQDINKEVLEDVHELLANGFLIVAIAHVAGIVLHTIRHRDWIGGSMIHGRKNEVEGEIELDRSHGGVAAVFLVIIGSIVFYLSQNYDAQSQQLNLFGKVLQLGEAEGEGEADSSENQGESEDSEGEEGTEEKGE